MLFRALGAGGLQFNFKKSVSSQAFTGFWITLSVWAGVLQLLFVESSFGCFLVTPDGVWVFQTFSELNRSWQCEGRRCSRTVRASSGCAFWCMVLCVWGLERFHIFGGFRVGRGVVYKPSLICTGLRDFASLNPEH